MLWALVAMMGCGKQTPCERSCAKMWGDDPEAGECDLLGASIDAGHAIQPGTIRDAVDDCVAWCEAGVADGWCVDTDTPDPQCYQSGRFGDFIACVDEASCAVLEADFMGLEQMEEPACQLWGNPAG